VRRFPRRIRCRFAERLGQFLVAAAHLHSGDDRFPLFRRQPLQGPLIALNSLTTDRLLEGRFATLDFDAVKTGDRRLPSFPPQLVQDAIEHRLTQVRLQRTDTARLDYRKALAAELTRRLAAAIAARALPEQDLAVTAPALLGAIMEGLVGPLAAPAGDDAKMRGAVQTVALFALRAAGVVDAHARGLVVQTKVPEGMRANEGARARP